MTARQIIETRLGYQIGALATVPKDTRRALYLLARQLASPGASRPIFAPTRKPRLP